MWDLHERDSFNESSFVELCDAITVLAAHRQKQGGALDRDTTIKVWHISSYILSTLIWHFDPNDGCRIKDLKLKRLHAYVERITSVVAGYLGGYPMTEFNHW